MSDSEMNREAVPSAFERLGGETQVRAIIDAFIDLVFADGMIGFFFRKADKNRIKEMEYQLAAGLLGARIDYHGRPLAEVHAKHPIMGGHFARRRQILKETLERYGVPPDIREAWLKHTDSLRPLITAQEDSHCDPVAVAKQARQPG